MFKVKTSGRDKFAANVRRIVEKVESTAIDNVLKEAIEPMRRETRANARALRDVENVAPKGGHLDQGIAVRKLKTLGRGERGWRLGFIRRARFIAHLVEFGTEPHDQPQRGVKHPGSRPKPFFRPAFEANKQKALDIVKARSWVEIREAIKRV
jgi:HK97 gp10 family phage protein